jgi:hypothetical protein
LNGTVIFICVRAGAFEAANALLDFRGALQRAALRKWRRQVIFDAELQRFCDLLAREQRRRSPSVRRRRNSSRRCGWKPREH